MAHISAPGSSSRPTSPMKYHVFLSFRGIDTRKSFTDHLYSALLRKGIVTFRDDQDLERGEFISKELLQAIEQSLFAIVVLSNNYASSSWCLDELQKIVESRQDLGQTVFPVFYGVAPSDIRHQEGNFATAFEEHEASFSDDKVRKWREALTKIANLSGWDTRDKHEAIIVDDIVNSVWNKLCYKLPSNFKHLVGDIQSKAERIISLLKIGLDDKCFMGIWGMGGIGKTTLARVVYNAIRSKFDACCFLANVREDSERFGLVYIQKKLLSSLGLGEQKINDSYDGGEVIENFLCHKKVLIVFDDVSHRRQLDNLARNDEWFGVGSKIMITTRDVQLLTQYEQFEEYEVRGLCPDESLKLLCHKAFKKEEPEEGYLNLSKEAIEYACGLPLALEVLGSFLCKRKQYEWRDALDKLRQHLHKDIFSPLRISYDALEDEEYKTIFLDIACFFNGKRKVEVTNIFKICSLHPDIGINVLIEKSLLSSSQLNSNSSQNTEDGQDMHDRIQKMRRDIFLPTFMYHRLLHEAPQESWHMHDLLEEMGRNIVLQESPSDAGKRSRLWSLEDIDLVLKGNKGTEKLQGIVMDLRGFKANWHPDCFSKMQNLRLLSLSGVCLSNKINSLPSALKFLRWDFYAWESLPSIDQLFELGSLQLRFSKMRNLWNGNPALDKLRFIDLSSSKYVTETPDFSGTPNLDKLVLNHCPSLVRVHESVGQLKKLVELSMEECENLVSLPGYLEMNNLEVLILGGCKKLEKLPEFGKNMRSLYVLDVTQTSITEVPSSIIHLINLKYLDLSFCHSLESLPELPPNLIVCASWSTWLNPASALRHLNASRVPKGPIHVFSDSDRHLLHGNEKIPKWFERREHRHSKGDSSEVVTITADIPRDVGDYERKCWTIAVCIVFESLFDAWRGFSINWEFQDYCHPNNNTCDAEDCRDYVGFYDIHKERGHRNVSNVIGSRVYIGYFPVDYKEKCRPHPSGVGRQVDLTLSFPITNTLDHVRYLRNLEIVDCGWRLVCIEDFEALPITVSPPTYGYLARYPLGPELVDCGWRLVRKEGWCDWSFVGGGIFMPYNT